MKLKGLTMCAMLTAPLLLGQRWDLSIAPWPQFAAQVDSAPATTRTLPSSVGGDRVAGAGDAPPALRITASRQPLAVLRAVAGQAPEGAALYLGRACATVAKSATVDPGQIEQAMESRGIAISTRPLAQLAVQRSRSRALSVLARVGQAAQWAGPVVLGLAAGGSIELPTWGLAAVGVASQALRLASDATAGERGAVQASLADLGLWLSDMPQVTLGPGQCSPRFAFLGAYRPDILTVVVEE